MGVNSRSPSDSVELAAGATAAAMGRPMGSRVRGVLGRDWLSGWVFLIPALLVIVGLMAYPFISAIGYSLQNIRMGGEGTWAGFRNYETLLLGLQQRYFLTTVRVTVHYVLVCLAGKFLLGMISALVLHSAIRARSLFRALLFLPWAVPAVVSAQAWKWIYDENFGVINLALIELGVLSTAIPFRSGLDIAIWSVIIGATWQGTPFWTMCYLAGLQSISRDLYEAASIDGASTWQQFWAITLPNLTSVITVTFMLSAIWTANSLQYVFIITGGGPARTTETFPMYAFIQGIRVGNLGLAATIPLLFTPLFAVMIYFLTKQMLQQEA